MLIESRLRLYGAAMRDCDCTLDAARSPDHLWD